MKEIDFLPEWYREGRRRQLHVRKQYAALVLVFLGMMAFNLTAIQRAGNAAAALAVLEDERMRAEAVVHEFDAVTAELGKFKAKSDLMEQTDPKIDVAAMLAEMSHLINESVVLRRVEFVAEPFSRWKRKEEIKHSTARPAAKPKSEAAAICADVVFRVVLAGVATGPGHVGDLVCRLDESPYFRRVYPSFSRNTTISLGGGRSSRSANRENAGSESDVIDATEFEISCYLANVEDVGT